MTINKYNEIMNLGKFNHQVTYYPSQHYYLPNHSLLLLINDLFMR